MPNYLIRQYKGNQYLIDVKKYSRKKILFLGILPILGFLAVILGITYDLYKMGEVNISPDSNAAWELYATDKNIVMFSEEPEKYLALTKNVGSEEKVIDTMKYHEWSHIGFYRFEKNG